MTYAFDRTMLSRFGFQDPDRKDRHHEMACHYLAKNGLRLYKRILPVDDPWFRECQRKVIEKCRGCRNGEPCDPWAEHRCRDVGGEKVPYVKTKSMWRHEFEPWVYKGDGKYRVDIGRLDLLLTFRHEYTFNGRHGAGEWVEADEITRELKMAVEVKISRVSVSDIIAQLGLYRAHFKASAWVLVAPFSLSDLEVQALKNEDIKFLRLGPEFDDFCASYETSEKENEVF